MNDAQRWDEMRAAMDDLRATFSRYNDGDPLTPWVLVRDSVVRAVCAWEELLAEVTNA